MVCAPSVYLATPSVDAHFELGAQDVNENAKGAFTGEVSAAMLADLGVRWCIVGHPSAARSTATRISASQRRCARWSRAGVRPIVCVGETRAEREAGATRNGRSPPVGRRALARSGGKVGRTGVRTRLGDRHRSHRDARNRAGSSRGPRARRAHGRSRRGLVADSLYGGSVKPSNAAELFA